MSLLYQRMTHPEAGVPVSVTFTLLLVQNGSGSLTVGAAGFSFAVTVTEAVPVHSFASVPVTV